MQRSLVLLAVLGSVVGTAVAGPAPSVQMPVRNWPKEGAFKLSEVYRTAPGNYGEVMGDPHGNPDKICPNKRFLGSTLGEENVEVIPGIFCLDTLPDCKINIKAFATCDPEKKESDPYIQSFRLTKKVPGSYKAPCYGDPENPPVYYQFGGDGIRTWWALKYTQPGTTFCLELTVRCLVPISAKSTKKKPVFHIDKWTWMVDITPDVFCLVIDMLHSTPLSVLEFPCIADEGVYKKLKYLAREFQEVVDDSYAKRLEKQEALFDLEGFIAQQCLQVDYFSPDYVREGDLGFDPSRIPGNFPTMAPSTYGGKGYGNWSPFSDPDDHGPDGGIVESFEDPCCCKLMADIEYLGTKLGIVSK